MDFKNIFDDNIEKLDLIYADPVPKWFINKINYELPDIHPIIKMTCLSCLQHQAIYERFNQTVWHGDLYDLLYSGYKWFAMKLIDKKSPVISNEEWIKLPSLYALDDGVELLLKQDKNNNILQLNSISTVTGKTLFIISDVADCDLGSNPSEFVVIRSWGYIERELLQNLSTLEDYFETLCNIYDKIL